MTSINGLCSNYINEATCEEAQVSCYWADHLTTPQCQLRPVIHSDCTCTLVDNKGNPNCGPGITELASWTGPSGCEPYRFCVYSMSTDECKVQLNLESDDSCYENGATNTCSPSEFCEPRANHSEGAFFLDLDCILKPGTTKFPTKAPVTRTPTISFSPTLSPTLTEEYSTINYVLSVGIGAGVSFVCAVSLFTFWLWKTNREDYLTSALVAAKMNASASKNDEDPHPDF